MELTGIWHCPRPALAAAYLQLLNTGLVFSASIFGPRRTGKTCFLQKDLTPAAAAAGYAVAYADLWQTRMSPGVALVRALEEALEPKTLGAKALDRLKRPVKKVKAKGSVGDIKGEFEVELDDPKQAATEVALRIEELVAKLVARKPLLLLVDEAQELARTRENEAVATALRTAMTKHRDRMRVVFTGSSRTRLAHVFSNPHAPLYSVGSAIQDFPLLGREFVEFVARKFHDSTRRRFDVEHAWRRFAELKQQPEPFLRAVLRMMMAPGLSLDEAVAQEQAALARSENHESTWAGLDALQKELARLFATDPAAKPFSKTVIARLRKSSGVPNLEVAHVQYAVRKLAEANLVVKSPRNLYEFDNDAFAQWVMTLAD